MDKKMVRFGPLSECTFEEALFVWNHGFAGYYSDMSRTLDAFVVQLGAHHIHPDLSVVAYADVKPIGFVLIGLKTVGGRRLAWNGGTGVIPEYRGKGIGNLLMKESVRRLKNQKIDTVFLEVVTKNKPAIASYENAGFRAVDRIIGLEREGAFTQVPFAQSDTKAGADPNSATFHIERRRPADVALLPLYREQAAWEAQWHNIQNGESYILSNRQGQTIAYALAKRDYDDEGQLKNISLYQCEIHPSTPRKQEVARALLTEVYAPFAVPCVRSTNNLSMSEPVLIDLLKQAGFTTRYEQYLMTLQF